MKIEQDLEVDDTVEKRMKMTADINGSIRSRDYDKERLRLKMKYGGEVWDSKELTEQFIVHGFMAPFLAVTRKSDNKMGSLMFQDTPRLYFAWSPASPAEDKV